MGKPALQTPVEIMNKPIAHDVWEAAFVRGLTLLVAGGEMVRATALFVHSPGARITWGLGKLRTISYGGKSVLLPSKKGAPGAAELYERAYVVVDHGERATVHTTSRRVEEAFMSMWIDGLAQLFSAAAQYAEAERLRRLSKAEQNRKLARRVPRRFPGQRGVSLTGAHFG